MFMSQQPLRVEKENAENTFSICAGESPAKSAILVFHNLKMHGDWELN